ncbi:unnamed protein product [Linum tenue]|nr:unnamed protein product [Linum tenue]
MWKKTCRTRASRSSVTTLSTRRCLFWFTMANPFRNPSSSSSTSTSSGKTAPQCCSPGILTTELKFASGPSFMMKR